MLRDRLEMFVGGELAANCNVTPAMRACWWLGVAAMGEAVIREIRSGVSPANILIQCGQIVREVEARTDPMNDTE